MHGICECIIAFAGFGGKTAVAVSEIFFCYKNLFFSDHYRFFPSFFIYYGNFGFFAFHPDQGG